MLRGIKRENIWLPVLWLDDDGGLSLTSCELDDDGGLSLTSCELDDDAGWSVSAQPIQMVHSLAVSWMMTVVCL